MHGKDAKSSASVRILAGISGSEGAREACEMDHLRPDSRREVGATVCTGRVPNRALEAGRSVVWSSTQPASRPEAGRQAGSQSASQPAGSQSARQGGRWAGRQPASQPANPPASQDSNPESFRFFAFLLFLFFLFFCSFRFWGSGGARLADWRAGCMPGCPHPLPGWLGGFPPACLPA